MTKLEFEIIPGFDVLKWKREVQMEIYEEIKNLTTREVVEYFHKGAERFDQKMAQRRYQRQDEVLADAEHDET